MKRVIIKPRGGLGSRLSMMAKGLTFAKSLNVTPKFIWPIGLECQDSWSSLFDSPSYYAGPHLDSIIFGHSNLSKYRLILDKYDHHIQEENIIWSSLYPQFEKGNIKDLLDFVGINSDLKIKIEYLKNKLDVENKIGLHVRRGDLLSNPKLKKDNLSRIIPTKEFFKTIYELGMQNEKFLLATESNMVEIEFNKRFPGQIERIPCKQYLASEKEAMKDALLTLILLSKTKEIISSYSFFSITAAHLGQIKNTVLRKGIYESEN